MPCYTHQSGIPAKGMLAEPITSLTDYAIALECLVFAGLLLRFSWVEYLWAAAFASVSVAAVLAGTFHGFEEVLSYRHQVYLWHGMRWALLWASFFAVNAAAGDCRKPWQGGLLALTTAKLAVLLALQHRLWMFSITVVDYLSALAFVLFLFIRRWQTQRNRPAWWQSSTGLPWFVAGLGISGLAAIMLVMPWPQRLRLSPFAVYHLIQMVALFCIYRSVCAYARYRLLPNYAVRE
jgi:hypothetical protein